MKKFKYILYKIASLKYGKIKYIKSADKVKDIEIKKINLEKNIFKKVYTLKNSRLYTDRIHNLALIHNNYLIEGPSYQIINNNYASCKKNIVLKIGTPRYLKKLKGITISLLSGGGANANYFHWLFDVLPRLNIIKKIFRLNKINYLLLPSTKKKFQIETLKILGFKLKQFLTSENFRHIESDQIIVSDHPWISSGNSAKDELKIPIWIYKWLKKSFLNKIKNIRKKKYPKNIFIIRRKQIVKNQSISQRELLNEDKILKIFKKKKYNFIDLENYNFLEQVSFFKNANKIAGVHGAGFANIVFCKRNTKIIEFKTRGTGDLYKNIAIMNNLKYFGLKSKINDKFNNQNGIIDIDINKLKKII